MQLIREKKPLRYVGVIGPVEFDKYGDIAGPFPDLEDSKWRSGHHWDRYRPKMCSAIQARLPKMNQTDN